MPSWWQKLVGPKAPEHALEEARRDPPVRPDDEGTAPVHEPLEPLEHALHPDERTLMYAIGDPVELDGEGAPVSAVHVAGTPRRLTDEEYARGDSPYRELATGAVTVQHGTRGHVVALRRETVVVRVPKHTVTLQPEALRPRERRQLEREFLVAGGWSFGFAREQVIPMKLEHERRWANAAALDELVDAVREAPPSVVTSEDLKHYLDRAHLTAIATPHQLAKVYKVLLGESKSYVKEPHFAPALLRALADLAGEAVQDEEAAAIELVPSDVYDADPEVARLFQDERDWPEREVPLDDVTRAITPQDLAAPDLDSETGAENIRRVLALATPEEREVYKDWYLVAHNQAKMLTAEAAALARAEGRRAPSFEVVCAVIATLSPGSRWEGNLRAARRLLLRTTVEGTGGVYPVNVYKALRAIEYDDPEQALTGDVRKVRPFYETLVDPKSAAQKAVVDRHMFAIWFGDPAAAELSPSDAVYQRIQADVRKVALESGLTTQAVQAITWHLWRNRSEATRAQLLRQETERRERDELPQPASTFSRWTPPRLTMEDIASRRAQQAQSETANAEVAHLQRENQTLYERATAAGAREVRPGTLSLGTYGWLWSPAAFGTIENAEDYRKVLEALTKQVEQFERRDRARDRETFAPRPRTALMREKDEPGEAACIVVPIPEPLASQWPAEKDNSGPHFTLVYVPGPHSEADKQAIVEEAELAAAATPVFEIELLSGYDSFTSDKNDKTVYHKAPTEEAATRLAMLAARLTAGLKERGLAPVERDKYLAHATLTYDTPPPADAVPEGRFRAGHVEVWGWPEDYRFPLSDVVAYEQWPTETRPSTIPDASAPSPGLRAAASGMLDSSPTSSETSEREARASSTCSRTTEPTGSSTPRTSGTSPRTAPASPQASTPASSSTATASVSPSTSAPSSAPSSASANGTSRSDVSRANAALRRFLSASQRGKSAPLLGLRSSETGSTPTRTAEVGSPSRAGERTFASHVRRSARALEGAFERPELWERHRDKVDAVLQALLAQGPFETRLDEAAKLDAKLPGRLNRIFARVIEDLRARVRYGDFAPRPGADPEAYERAVRPIMDPADWPVVHTDHFTVDDTPYRVELRAIAIDGIPNAEGQGHIYAADATEPLFGIAWDHQRDAVGGTHRVVWALASAGGRGSVNGRVYLAGSRRLVKALGALFRGPVRTVGPYTDAGLDWAKMFAEEVHPDFESLKRQAGGRGRRKQLDRKRRRFVRQHWYLTRDGVAFGPGTADPDAPDIREVTLKPGARVLDMSEEALRRGTRRAAALDPEVVALVEAVKAQTEALKALSLSVEQLLAQTGSAGYDAVRTEDRLIVLNPKAVEDVPKRRQRGCPIWY